MRMRTGRVAMPKPSCAGGTADWDLGPRIMGSVTPLQGRIAASARNPSRMLRAPAGKVKPAGRIERPCYTPAVFAPATTAQRSSCLITYPRFPGLHAFPFILLLLLGATAIPLRIGAVMLHRRVTLGEPWVEARDVGLFLGPTLVFSLAVADILRDRFQVPGWWVGGLVLYGVATSFLPLLTRKIRSMEFEDVLGMSGPGQAAQEIPGGGGKGLPGRG